jgi:NHL repeat
LTGSMKDRMKFPSTIGIDGRGNIYLADKNAGVLYILGQDGSIQGEQLQMGWKEGLLRYPSQICIDARGEFFIADRGNNRIQVFTTVQ